MNARPLNRTWIRSGFWPLAGLIFLFACPIADAANEPAPKVTSPTITSESLLNPNLEETTKNDTILDKSIRDYWKQLRDNYGITPFVWYWGDFLGNPSGGQTQSSAWFQLLEFGADLDFKRYGWEGGALHASASYASGHDLSQKIGNTFVVSQAVVEMTVITLDEVYLTQKVGENDQLQFSIGRMSAGSNFATLPVEGLSVNSATNSNPTSLYYNAPFNDMTGATWGTFGRVNASADTYTQVGIYQACPSANNPAYHGVNFSIHSTDGILAMMETGWTPTFGQTKEKPGYSGIYQVGVYYSNYTFPTFGGGNQPNAFGFYLQGQQMVWRDAATPDLNLTVWGGFTCSPQNQIALLPVMGFGGVDLHGPIPGRREDSLFMNVYTGGFSSVDSSVSIADGAGPLTRETVLEWGYVAQVTKHLQLQPDVQYISRPSGTDNIPNAVVVGFQVSAVF